MDFDSDKIRQAVQKQIALVLTSHSFSRETAKSVAQITNIFLSDLNEEQFENCLLFCINELAGNADKANAKGLYFNEHHLSLSRPSDYERGMKNFKKELSSRRQHYLTLLKEKGLYIKIAFQNKTAREGRMIAIDVKNSRPMTEIEQRRVKEKFDRAQSFKSLDEAFTKVLDPSEGAGLGLVIMLLMLQRIGLDKKSLSISNAGNETVARVRLPLDKIHFQDIQLLSRTIVANIESLPQLPENIIRLEKSLNDSEVKMSDITMQISQDPGLTAEVLKTVNSALYMLHNKVISLGDAVKLIGIRDLKNLLFSFSSIKLLGSETVEKRRLWIHSYKTALIAGRLAFSYRSLTIDPSLAGNRVASGIAARYFANDCYVAGILHDMGKIVFSNVHPALLRKIEKFCREKGISTRLIEELAAGLNHAEIGAMTAEKWQYPSNLVAAVRYHHDPLKAPAEFFPLVRNTYMANMLCNYEDGLVKYEQFIPQILKDYGIKSAEALDKLVTLVHDASNDETL